MKRILSFALVLMMLAGALISCGAKEPTLADLDAAFTKKKELKSYETDTTMKMNMTMMGITVDMTSNSNTKVAEVDGKEVSYDVTTVTMGEQKEETKTYTADGYSYVEEAGMKYKIASEDTEDLADGLKFNDETVESFTYEKLDEGAVKYDVKFKAGVLSDLLEESLGEELIGETENAEVEVTSSTFTLKDGYCTELKLALSMVVKDETLGNTNVAIDLTLVTKNPGADVEVPVPADLDSYEDLDKLDFGDYDIEE